MVTVTPLTPDDVPDLADLLAEMDQFYGDQTIGTAGERHLAIRQQLFETPQPAGYVVIARSDVRLVGMASYSYLWPAAGTSRSLFLKELFVAHSDQRRGVGRALMTALAKIATSAGCSRMEWTTDTTNRQAQDFYQFLNAPALSSKIFYRLTAEGVDLIVGDR